MEKNFLTSQHPKLESLPEHILDMARSMEAIPIGFAIVDLQGRILCANRKTLQALGYDAEELIGSSIEIILGSSMLPEEFQDMLEATLASGWVGEITNYRKDGSSFPAYMETSVIRDHDGRASAIVAVSRDVSEQRAFQNRLLAEAKLGTLGLIAHNVAHEVRNRLAAIKMSLYMLEKGRSQTGEEGLHFSIAKEELDRTEQFLRTLEDFANPRKPKFEEHDLIEVVNKGLEDARPMLTLKSVTLFRQFPRHAPRVVLDRDQFSQAITQVIQNASEALDREPEIHVVIKRQPREDRSWWLIEVRDNGPGIAPNIRERVFEPFFTTTLRQIGLGLSNVRRILLLHGGEALLSSETGKGTVVTLRVPQKPAAAG